MNDSSYTPQVSILMAAYNASAYLEDALQSVLRQTFSGWELLCVDDASKDCTREILRRHAASDSRIRVFHKDKNEGQAVARNEALMQARGDIIMMLDADDWLSDDCLESVAGCFSGQTDCVVLRLMEHYSQDGKEQMYAIPYNEDDVVSGYEAFVASLDWRLHGLYAVRRDIHLRYPYDTSCHLYSDDNTTRLHYLHSREVRFCSGTYYYRKHGESCTNSISPDRFLYMLANLSMRNTLIEEGVPQAILDRYESHRWLNYIDQLWLYSRYKRQFTKQERQRIEWNFRSVYASFSGLPVPMKFGYTRLADYRLFLLQEWLYFGLRKLMGR